LSKNIFVGIDLGTTNSVLAVVDEDEVVNVVANVEGMRTTPSVVFFLEDDAPLVGQEAKDSLKEDPSRVVQFVKREMGNPDYLFQVDPRDPDSAFSAEEISALVLQKLKKDAERRLGQTIRDVVITVPAYFRDAERQATLRAGKIAGLNVLELINEPTAAALAYGFEHRPKKEKVLVYDLGGGTFDVTVLEIDKGRFRVIATDGDSCLGGKEFDDRLMQHFVRAMKEQKGVDPSDNPSAMLTLREEAEKYKIRLSNRSSIPVMVQDRAVSLGLDLTRDTFEELTVDLLRRTEELVVYTLQTAKLTWQDVDTILLVGGSTRMPMVPAMLRRLSGKEPSGQINPDEAVAIGAAHQARIASGVTLGPDDEPIRPITDVATHSLGVVTVDSTGQEINSVVLGKNTPLPATTLRTFYPAEDFQTDVKLKVTQGEDQDMRYCRIVGEYVLGPLPSRKRGETRVQVTFQYDASGQVKVRARDEASGKSIEADVIVVASTKGEGHIQASKARLARAERGV